MRLRGKLFRIAIDEYQGWAEILLNNVDSVAVIALAVQTTAQMNVSRSAQKAAPANELFVIELVNINQTLFIGCGNRHDTLSKTV